MLNKNQGIFLDLSKNSNEKSMFVTNKYPCQTTEYNL